MSAAAVPAPAPSRPPKPLEDLFRKACETQGPRALVEWMFLEAKAKGDLVIAERELRALEATRDAVVYRSWHLVETEAARALVMAHAPNEIDFGRAQREVSEATEKASVCAPLIEHLSRRPPPAPAPPQQQGVRR